MSTWQAMGYKKTNIHLAPNANKIYISDIAYDSQFPFVTYPTSVGSGGNETNPIGDYGYIDNDATMRFVILGGSAWYGLIVGPFAWSSNDELLFAASDIGALASAFPVVSTSSL